MARDTKNASVEWGGGGGGQKGILKYFFLVPGEKKEAVAIPIKKKHF